MGCAASHKLSSTSTHHDRSVRLSRKRVSVSVSEDHKIILSESWKLLEQEKTNTGKRVFIRLLQLNPNLQDTFPSFKGVALDELMNSRSLFLHSKRLMAIVEEAVSSLNDAQKFIDDLKKLGEKHLAMSISQKHLKVMEEAFILTLSDILGECCTEEVTRAWRELFRFLAVTMLTGLGQAEQKSQIHSDATSNKK